MSTKKHPKHLARPIRSIGNNELVGWSIYPEQVPAMKRKMWSTAKRFGVSLSSEDLDAMFAAIGIGGPK